MNHMPSDPRSNISYEEMCCIVNKAIESGTLVPLEDQAVLFYDVSFIEERLHSLKEAFPATTLHAIAAKANPLTKILSIINKSGFGIEVASLPELYMAEKAGFASDSIVFDSPCKTSAEIEYALQAGVYLNADSFNELDRIAEILKKTESKSKIGLRINPQVGAGSIQSTSVAGAISKFGIPLHENRERIINYYVENKWLQGIHVHIGSQGCPVNFLVEGIRQVLDLAIEINVRLKFAARKPISVFDIGGGLPVSYQADQEPVKMKQYVSWLMKSCPELFSGEFRLVTEFGRYIYANAGWVASKVEYVKREPANTIIMTHVGADLFLRKCYNPGDWHHHISVVDKNGVPKNGKDAIKYMVAGPLCFAGDVLAKDLELPEVLEGDYLLIHDAGAYTLSMWSRYNSRQMPIVIGYRNDCDGFMILKEKESKNDLLKFWSSR